VWCFNDSQLTAKLAPFDIAFYRDFATTEGYNLSMRRLWVWILLFTAVPLSAQTNAADAIIAQENAFWKSYVDGNTGDLSNLLFAGLHQC
jgi:hypothetical protein